MRKREKTKIGRKKKVKNMGLKVEKLLKYPDNPFILMKLDPFFPFSFFYGGISNVHERPLVYR